MAKRREPSFAVSARIEDCVSFLVGKAAQRITRRCRDALAPLGITPVQYAVLNVLWERDAQSLAELGNRLVLDSATMTGVADRLVAAGLVTRAADPGGDRRISLLMLEPAGKALQAEAQAVLAAVNRAVVDELGSQAGPFWQALRQVGEVSGADVAGR